MSELLLVSNPKRRRKKSRKGRMPAGLKKYWAARRAGKAAPRKRRRKHALKARASRRTKGRRHPAMGYTIGSRKIRRRKLNPHRRRARYHRRRNPSLRSLTGQVVPTIKAGAWGAAGAIGLDALWGLLVANLPSLAGYLTNPFVTFAAKAAGAVGVGMIGGKIARGRGRDLAVGAMTVVTHDLLKTQLQSMAPTIFGPGGSVPLGAYLSDINASNAFGAYLSGAAPIVGTATIPQSYLPFAGSTGNSGSDGVYNDDRMGLDNWS